MSKKKVILIGLACLILISGITAVILNLKSGTPEETTLPKSPGQGAVEGQPIDPTKTPEPTKQPTKEPIFQPTEITVIQLHTEYYGNQISAEQKYLNKVLRVTGEVSNIARDIGTGKAAVFIGGSHGKYYPVVFVKCVFKNETEVVALKGGQMVTIEGKFVGDRLEAVLRMENCSLVK